MKRRRDYPWSKWFSFVLVVVLVVERFIKKTKIVKKIRTATHKSLGGRVQQAHHFLHLFIKKILNIFIHSLHMFARWFFIVLFSSCEIICIIKSFYPWKSIIKYIYYPRSLIFSSLSFSVCLKVYAWFFEIFLRILLINCVLLSGYYTNPLIQL